MGGAGTRTDDAGVDFGADVASIGADGGGRGGVVDVDCDTLDVDGGGVRTGGIGAGMGVRMDEVGIGAPAPTLIPAAGAEAARDDVEALFVIDNVVACPAIDALGKRIVSGVRTRG
jgi:hypothetical protein